jgi:hypothetical protein
MLGTLVGDTLARSLLVGLNDTLMELRARAVDKSKSGYQELSGFRARSTRWCTIAACHAGL